MWRVFVGKSAQKALARVPERDAVRLTAAIRAMATDPYAGDIRMLAANEYRRRVGSYRIRYEVNAAFRAVQVVRIDRRTSTTYRRR
jgi:mRNA-degrading endonuclease RelE of RelBE toxin-antitoxin system